MFTAVWRVCRLKINDLWQWDVFEGFRTWLLRTWFTSRPRRSMCHQYLLLADDADMVVGLHRGKWVNDQVTDERTNKLPRSLSFLVLAFDRTVWSWQCVRSMLEARPLVRVFPRHDWLLWTYVYSNSFATWPHFCWLNMLVVCCRSAGTQSFFSHSVVLDRIESGSCIASQLHKNNNSWRCMLSSTDVQRLIFYVHFTDSSDCLLDFVNVYRLRQLSASPEMHVGSYYMSFRF
jgi:hypothetical protein